MIKVKDKKKILKAARGKQLLIHNENSIRLSTDSSEEISQATRNVMTYSKCCKEKKKPKNFQPKILYQARLSLRNGETKSFTEKII